MFMNWSSIDWPTTLQVTANVATIVAALSAVILGYKGLQTWRRELYGATTHALAKDLLVSTLRWRNAIFAVRQPWSDGAEIAMATEKFDLEAPDHSDRGREVRYQRAALQYRYRWSFVQEALAEVQKHVLVAEALLGPSIETEIRELIRVQNSLFLIVEEYLFQLSDVLEDVDPEQRKETRQKIFAFTNDDDFAAEVNEVVRRITETLRPYLRIEK